MGWRNTNTEADDYDAAGDKATKRGQHNAAEMFHDMAASERVEADRDRRAEGRTQKRRG